MLVLSRKRNETIVIGPNVEIHVLKISGNSVRLGISAPKDVKVIRGELAPYDIEAESSSSQSSQEKARPVDAEAEEACGLRLVAEFDLPLESFGEQELRIANPFAPVV